MKKIVKTRLIFVLMIFFAGISLNVQAADIVKIDINKATVKEFTKLNKIGPKTAEKIVEYRKKNGPFKSIEDLMKVKGVGEKIFKLNKAQIVVLDTSKEKVKHNKGKTSKKAD